MGRKELQLLVNTSKKPGQQLEAEFGTQQWLLIQTLEPVQHPLALFELDPSQHTLLPSPGELQQFPLTKLEDDPAGQHLFWAQTWLFGQQLAVPGLQQLLLTTICPFPQQPFAADGEQHGPEEVATTS
jgi:hypothetical protein